MNVELKKELFEQRCHVQQNKHTRLIAGGIPSELTSSITLFRWQCKREQKNAPVLTSCG